MPGLPKGVPARMACLAASGSDSVISVSMKPGATAFTLMLRGASSRAAEAVLRVLCGVGGGA